MSEVKLTYEFTGIRIQHNIAFLFPFNVSSADLGLDAH